MARKPGTSRPAAAKAGKATKSAKPRTTRAPAGVSATGPAAPEEPTIVSETAAVVTGPEMKKQELLDKVVRQSEVKKKFAKPVVEAMLEVLGEALSEGRDLNLEPLGKLKQNRVKDHDKARVIVARIRQGRAAGRAPDSPKTGLAEASE